MGVVWGDGKPGNILIHAESDECFLVDFGGSFTDGRVDERWMKTTTGDEQAVKKIVDYLVSWSKNLAAAEKVDFLRNDQAFGISH